MPIAQEGGDSSPLEELVDELKLPSAPNTYRSVIQEGLAGLDVSRLDEQHRKYASAVFPLLVTEELTPFMSTGPVPDSARPLPSHHRWMRDSLAALFPTVPSTEDPDQRRGATEMRVIALRNSITATANGITKPDVRNQFLSIANSDAPQDDADLQWFAVMLSLLSYQAADAKLTSQRDDLAAELDESLARAKHLDSLIATLFPKPDLENAHDVTLRSTTPVIKPSPF